MSNQFYNIEKPFGRCEYHENCQAAFQTKVIQPSLIIREEGYQSRWIGLSDWLTLKYVKRIEFVYQESVEAGENFPWNQYGCGFRRSTLWQKEKVKNKY